MIRMSAITVFVALVPGAFLLAPVRASDEGSVTIESPKDGARLGAMKQTSLVYEVLPGPDGNHVHFYLDDKEVGILRQLKGSYALPTLAAGKHDICIKVVNKGHTPIGLQRCVGVTVE